MAVRHKIANTRRVEVIINGVAVRTTARQIRDGLGRFGTINEASRGALERLEEVLKDKTEKHRGIMTVHGIMGTFGKHNVQLDLL